MHGGPDRVGVDEQLDRPRPVAQGGERQAAVVADQGQPARDAHPVRRARAGREVRVLVADLLQRVVGRVAVGLVEDALVVNFVQPPKPVRALLGEMVGRPGVPRHPTPPNASWGRGAWCVARRIMTAVPLAVDPAHDPGERVGEARGRDLPGVPSGHRVESAGDPVGGHRRAELGRLLDLIAAVAAVGVAAEPGAAARAGPVRSGWAAVPTARARPPVTVALANQPAVSG